MPIYSFEDPGSGTILDLFFGMDDDKKYVDESGVEWRRIYGSPQLNTMGSIDPWNSNDFINKTSSTKGAMGDLMDRSKELSNKRASENNGVDPVKQQYFKNYSNERKGAKHMEDPSRDS
tara:strand:- start:28311 stop:28667 length:357 start_codon:yes stop_codon:yes gene_type:complete